jgi:hypothetical protein
MQDQLLFLFLLIFLRIPFNITPSIHKINILNIPLVKLVLFIRVISLIIWILIIDMDLYIFIDESGDLGFSEKSSSVFLLGGIATLRHFQIQRIPKKIRQNLHKKLKNMPELKANRSDTNVRKKVLEELTKCDDTIVIFKPCQKRLISNEIRNNLNKEIKIYDYLLNQLIKIIPDSMISIAHSIHLIIDDHWKNPKLRHSLQELLKNSIILRNKCQNKSFFIDQINSITCNELQVVDFVINSCFRAFERKVTTEFCYLVQNINLFNA